MKSLSVQIEFFLTENSYFLFRDKVRLSVS